MFRFTLGNDEVDRQVPRIVGSLGGVLLVVNHLLSPSPTEAQARTEAIGAVLAAVCAAAPAIDARLKDLGPGRGRKALAEQIAGATNTFLLADGLGEAGKKECAWASFALLKNTNSCGVLLFDSARQEVLMCRGAVAAAAVSGTSNGDRLRSLSASVGKAVQDSGDLRGTAPGPLVYADRAALASGGVSGWSFVPQGVESLVVYRAGGSRLLFLLSERARALSEKERLWSGAVADKLARQL